MKISNMKGSLPKFTAAAVQAAPYSLIKVMEPKETKEVKEELS